VTDTEKLNFHQTGILQYIQMPVDYLKLYFTSSCAEGISVYNCNQKITSTL